MKKLAIILAATGVILSGCSTTTEPVVDQNYADKRAYYSLLEVTWATQSSYAQESICMNWKDDRGLVTGLFMVESMDMEIYQNSSLEMADVKDVIESFFDKACAR